jgi:hypothetical protein
LAGAAIAFVLYRRKPQGNTTSNANTNAYNSQQAPPMNTAFMQQDKPVDYQFPWAGSHPSTFTQGSNLNIQTPGELSAERY